MEIYKIKITEKDRQLVSGFMGEGYPLEIDFNCLMPVVQKIIYLGWQFQLNSYSISNDAMFINAEGSRIQNIAWSTPLLATYNVVIDFIKFYNQNK